jgi:hypothetical protein
MLMVVSPSCQAQPGRALPAQPILERVGTQTSASAGEFPAFCEAVRTWLHQAKCLDPSLAAVADLVETMQARCAEDQLVRLTRGAADMHAALGASALLSLWSGLPR